MNQNQVNYHQCADDDGDCASNKCMCQAICSMDAVRACGGCWMYCSKNPEVSDEKREDYDLLKEPDDREAKTFE